MQQLPRLAPGSLDIIRVLECENEWVFGVMWWVLGIGLMSMWQ